MGIETEYADRHILAELAESVTPADVAGLLAQNNIQIIEDFDRLNIGLLEVSKGDDLLQMIDFLNQNQLFRYAEPNFVLRTDFHPNDPYYTGFMPSPDDYEHQWGLHHPNEVIPPGGIVDADIDAPEAWDYETGNSDVLIAVLDTGISMDADGTLNHPDLDNTGRIFLGPDLSPDDGDEIPRDITGHGTHVTGIIAAETHNVSSPEGIAGICWDCSILAIQVFHPAGYAYIDDIKDGIYAAIDADAQIINMSGGISIPPTVLERAVHYADSLGIFQSYSAGNQGETMQYVHFPARFAHERWFLFGYDGTVGYSGVTSVGATQHTDERASYSSYSEPNVFHITVTAPGGNTLGQSNDPTNIFSTLPSTLSEIYGYHGGTSMAAPHVSGLAGLLLSRNPQYSASDIRHVIERTAEDVNSETLPGRDNELGYGRINAYHALTRCGNLAIDTEWTGEFTTCGDVIVPDGVTLTIADNAIIYLWPSSKILVEPGGHLEIGAAEIIAQDASNKIEVHNASITSTDATFSIAPQNVNMYWSGFGIKTSQATFTRCNIRQTNRIIFTGNSNVLIEDNTNITNCPGGINCQNSSIVVRNSVIRDADYGIKILRSSTYRIEGNSIAVDNIGIDVSLSWDGEYEIIDNHIFGANTGVRIYDSWSILGENSPGNCCSNTIEDNGVGLVVLNHSSVTLTGNLIQNSKAEEIQFDHSSKLDMDWRINQIIDDEYPNPTDLYLATCLDHPIVTNGPHKMRKNYWGESYGQERFSPYGYAAFDIFPIWDDPPPLAGLDALYQNAGQAVTDENYATAETLYRQIVSEYPESEEAKASLLHLFHIEKIVDQDFPDLREYYQTQPNRGYDEQMEKTTNHAVTLCHIAETNYVEAVSLLEDIVQNPPSLKDSVFAVIDIGHVYFIMEGDSTAVPQSVVGSMPELRPVSFQAYQERKEELLSMIRVGYSIGLQSPSDDRNAALDLSEYRLEQNYPNPFNPVTVIRYTLAESGEATLQVYNSAGQLVRTLSSG
ncbi:MAG: hypothetical protein B6244_14765, partial [Candidatus Cloacimonetes bacterium 4572_55]